MNPGDGDLTPVVLVIAALAAVSVSAAAAVLSVVRCRPEFTDDGSAVPS